MKIILPTLFLLLAVVVTKAEEGIPSEAEISVNGVDATVSIHELDEALTIKGTYEPRDDLDAYPWFRPLLFTSNGFALHVAKEEWANYCEPGWTASEYADLETELKTRKRLDLSYKLSDVVLCRMDGGTYLICNSLLQIDDDKLGVVGGYRITYLKSVDGKWVNPRRSAIKELKSKLDACYGEAYRLLRYKKELKYSPIRELPTA